MGLRVGIDTGGTFTDLVGIDETTGSVVTAKRPSTPGDPVAALLAVIEDVRAETGRDVSILIHGTTVSTNCLLERKGANVLYITTEGFTDIPFIQRINRKYNYNLQWVKPKPLVKRQNSIGVPERIDHHGHIVIPLDKTGVLKLGEQIAKLVKTNGIETIAISLLNSFKNPQHEEMLSDMLHELLPDIPVSVSHKVAPIWREYPRASTIIADAYVKPLVRSYIHSLKQGLQAENIVSDFAVMKSNGGIMQADVVPDQPLHTLLSGLAGGLIGGRYLGQLSGFDNLLTLDMGGTSADVGMIWQGKQRHTTQFEIEWGLPVITPTLAVHTIGAGGGSIGWLDKGGMLHAGPQSAGANPGPACYGTGGTEPTITDANLLLGRLNPDYFLGGRIPLNPDLAYTAIEPIAKQLQLSVYETAHAMIEVANGNMSDAVRLVSILEGYDPRKFILVAFGGAGPLHAAAIARKLSVPKVVVPIHPGLCSAFGLLMADMRVDRVWTRAFRSDRLDLSIFNQELDRLKDEATEELRAQRYEGEVLLLATIGMRYLGQSHEHSINLPTDHVSAEALSAAYERFHSLHEDRYGYRIEGETVELVDFNVSAVGTTVKPELEVLSEEPLPEPVAYRPVHFAQVGMVDTPIYRRPQLPSKASLAGPAVIEEVDSTTLVHPGHHLTVNPYGIMILDLVDVL